MISIRILTKNEERKLPECLEFVGWSDDIHVYDSLRTWHMPRGAAHQLRPDWQICIGCK